MIDILEKNIRIIDLSRELKPGKERFKLEIKTFFVDEYLKGYHRERDDWYILQEVTMCSHVGTHIESPYHHKKDGIDCSKIPLNIVIGEAIILDFSYKKDKEAIKLSEIKNKKVKKNDIVIIKMGWDKYYGTKRYYKDRPYLTIESTQWILDRKIKCIGVDSPGIEPTEAVGQPVHCAIFRKDIPIIEDLQNLNLLKKERVFIIALPWKVKNLDASPTRVVALERK